MNTFSIVVFTKHPANNWIKHLFALKQESIKLTILQTPPILSHLYNQLSFSVKRNKLRHISFFFTIYQRFHCLQNTPKIIAHNFRYFKTIFRQLCSFSIYCLKFVTRLFTLCKSCFSFSSPSIKEHCIVLTPQNTPLINFF